MNNSPNLFQSLTRCAAMIALATLLACTVTVDSQGGTQNAALIDRLPSGATAIAWIDFEALAESMTPEEWVEYEEMFERDEDRQDLERFTAATGIDLREDMKQVAVAVMPGGGEDDDPLVLAHVNYDEDRLMGLFADAETRTYEGVTLFAANDVFRQLEETVGQSDEDEAAGDAEGGQADAEDPERQGYLAMLDGRTLAMGSAESLEIAIDVDNGRRDALKTDPAMNDLISDVAGQGQIWLVATRDTWDEQIDNLGDAGGGMVPTNAVESIEVVTMSMRMGGGMAMRLAGVAANPDDATLLADTLRGWTAMGKMMLQQNQPELFQILDRGISVGQDDRTVHIEANLSRDDLDILRRLAEEQLGEGEVIGAG